MKTLEQIKNNIVISRKFYDISVFEKGVDGFRVILRNKQTNIEYCVVFSWGRKWEHASISLDIPRCPVWEEMCMVKDLFWNDNETVVQFHPTKEYYVNNHPYCLHLWKPIRQDIPLPPKDLV
jgi:hypothetical protein